MKIGTIQARTAEMVARICAELAKQNIAFRAEQFGDEWVITITGY